MRGKFITFEGPECCGKTTQMRLLESRLNGEAYRTIWTREPGGSLIGPALRKILLTPGTEVTPLQELMIFYCDRSGHIEQIIKPHLADGVHVLSDRFYDSTRAYQHYGRGVPMALLDKLHDVAVGDFKPDATLLYMIPVPEIERRAIARKASCAVAAAESRFDDETNDFHARVCDGYRALAAAEPQRFIVLDGCQSIDTLHEQTYAAIRAVLDR